MATRRKKAKQKGILKYKGCPTLTCDCAKLLFVDLVSMHIPYILHQIWITRLRVSYKLPLLTCKKHSLI